MTHSFVKTCAGRTSNGNTTRTKTTKPQAKHMMNLNSASSMHARNWEIKFNLSARWQQSTIITNLELRCRMSMESFPTNTVGLIFKSTPTPLFPMNLAPAGHIAFEPAARGIEVELHDRCRTIGMFSRHSDFAVFIHIQLKSLGQRCGIHELPAE